MLIGALVIGVLVGSLTGLLGAGGAIIALPLLVYALGIPMADAVPMMLAVGVLSPISALLPRLRTDVDWRSVAAVGAAGILGAYGGTVAGAHLPERLTLTAFALLDPRRVGCCAAAVRATSPLRSRGPGRGSCAASAWASSPASSRDCWDSAADSSSSRC